MDNYIFDLETYPNCFLFTAKHAESSLYWQYEISDWKNESADIVAFCNALAGQKARMVGFNSIGFDYPILHQLLRMGRSDANTLYQKAQAIIGSQDENRWMHMVKPSERIAPQLDLFLIHHFDNRARATSLKALEFNMRADSIKDLPFPVGMVLTKEQIVELRAYNVSDVHWTHEFYKHSLDAIRFREQLSAKYDRDFLNHNDTKIGKDFFIMELEKAGIQCYDYSPELGRTPRQTKRPSIALKDAILPWIKFEHPELTRLLDWLKQQTITETKNVFKGLEATVNGFTLTFGLGGIHGSVENHCARATPERMILDLDVSSYYPNLAIVNKFYPEHLGEKFCEIYQNLYEQRKQFKKGTPENAVLKLALNGSYGDSNNPYSVFYDPLMTMKITLNGQLLLCKLFEYLIRVPSVKMLAANTDGLTLEVNRSDESVISEICDNWCAETGLVLEKNKYKVLHIADVNSFIGESESGVVKRKGRYEYARGWHQDHSALVVPKVAEQVLLHGAPIRETVMNWSDKMDFMLRVRVPRTGYLSYRVVGTDTDTQIQNTSRYMVAKGGVQLAKWLPPFKGGAEWRRSAVEAGWLVCICNEIRDATLEPDWDFYVQEVEKLTLGVM